MSKLFRSLRESSIEAIVLSLEIINKLSISYRLQTFAFLFCNAWELLLKAKLVADKRKIFYRKKRGKPRLSLSLDDCLARLFTDADDPIKLNIERVAELRNNAMHLVIPAVPPDVMALFQAGVINYCNKLREWLGVEISQRIPLGMMSLVYDVDPSAHPLDGALLKRKVPAQSLVWLKAFQDSVRAQADNLGTAKDQFYIPINLKLALVKNPKAADVVLSSGPRGKEAVLVEVPKNPDTTHPYRQKDVIAAVNPRITAPHAINSYDLLCVRKVHNIEPKAEFYYKSKFASPQYSGAFVDWIVEQFEKNPDFFTVAKTKCKAG